MAEGAEDAGTGDAAALARRLEAQARRHHDARMEIADRQLMLAGRQAALQLRGIRSIGHLSDVEFRVTSQMGEDGIVEWLVQNLPIRSERFVEIGTGDYRESNTRFLLRHRNWKGLVVEADADAMAAVRASDLYWRHDLTAVAAFVDAGTVDGIVRAHGFDGEVGLLSIDVDGNDLWILEALAAVRADILVCEYNPVYGDRHALTVPYDPAFRREAAHPSWLHFGASIRALERVAARQGYVLVGSNGAGHNAFFVRAELADGLAIADRSARPSLIRESRGSDGRLSHVGGLARADLIADAPVLDLETGAVRPLGTFAPLYGAAWERRITGRPPDPRPAPAG